MIDNNINLCILYTVNLEYKCVINLIYRIRKNRLHKLKNLNRFH